MKTKQFEVKKDIATGQLIFDIKESICVRNLMTETKIVKEGINKDWGHTVLTPNLYAFSINGRELNFEPVIEARC